MTPLVLHPLPADHPRLIMAGLMPTRTIHELVHDHLTAIIRADAERLEADCTRAIMLQRFDMLDRLEVVEVLENEAGWRWYPRAVASSLR